MTLLVQISDPHFGTEQAPVVEALVRFVREQSPSIAILSGDITQRARRAQFHAARAFVERLSVPHTLVIPGNHDIPLYNLAARVARPYAEFRRAFGRDLEPEFESDAVLVLTLNTTRAYLHEKRRRLAAQIERVARRLERAQATQLRIVVTHQPVSVTRREDRADLLHGHARAVRRWTAAGADLILGGHIHLPFVQALQGSSPRRRAQVLGGAGGDGRVLARAQRCRQLGQPDSMRDAPPRRGAAASNDGTTTWRRLLSRWSRATNLVFDDDAR